MIRTMTQASLCAAIIMTAVPAMAAPKPMPQGKRDEMSMKNTQQRISAQRKENKEANKNVDGLITNRK